MIITWRYFEVCQLLVVDEMPSCVRYDNGYTNVWSVQAMAPNHVFKSVERKYRPAWELQKASLKHERRQFLGPNPASKAAVNESLAAE